MCLRLESQHSQSRRPVHDERQSSLTRRTRIDRRLISTRRRRRVHTKDILPLDRTFERRIPRRERRGLQSNRESANIEWIGVITSEFLRRDAVHDQRALHLVARIAIIPITRNAQPRATRTPKSNFAAPLHLSIIESVTTAR